MAVVAIDMYQEFIPADMKNKYLLSIVILVAVVIGGYFLLDFQKEIAPEGENFSGKPAVQSHRSYEMELTSKLAQVEPGKPVAIAYKIKNDKGQILKNYEVVHEKIMHFIVIRKDLQYFQHIHPTFNESTGDFNIDVTFPTNGPYRMFPDFTPAKSKDNPQLLPVTLFKDIEVEDLGKYTTQNVKPDITGKKTVGDYEISFIIQKQEQLKAQKELTYSLVISKNGQPVKDLENYLGALGHSVILRAGNLDFIHTHPKTMTGSNTDKHMMQGADTKQSTGPQIDFETSFPEPGIYKIFTQFRHQEKVITVDYAIQVN